MTPDQITPAPGPVRVQLRPRPGRLGPLGLSRLVPTEAAAALVLIGLTTGGTVLLGCGTVAAVLLALALPQWNGLSPAEQLRARLLLRARRRRSAAYRVDLLTDPALVPLLECDPALRTIQHLVDPDAKAPAGRREHREIGMVGDGSFLTAVLQLEPPDQPLRPRRGAGSLPLELLGAALRVDDIVLDAIQVVQYTQTSPAPHLPEQSLAARGYRELPDGSGTPGLRLTWVGVRLDPELCPSAIAARGGGEAGARRALQRAVDQLTVRLAGAGLRATVLDRSGLTSAVATAICANPLTVGSAAAPGHRTTETVRAWRCDDRWHTSYWIAGWPRLTRTSGRGGPGDVMTGPDLVNLLTGASALGSTFSLTVRQASGGAVALTGRLRITARGERELEQATRQLESRARSAGALLVRLDHEQVPGVLATLPLGGSR